MEIKIVKVGGSQYIIIPSEYIKVFDLLKYLYTFNISGNGKTLTYRRLKKDPYYKEEVGEELEEVKQ